MDTQEHIGHTWENKVEKVIQILSERAFVEANFDKRGRRYKKYRPYRIPEEAAALVNALGRHDRALAEVEAKTIMEDLRRRGAKTDC